MQQVQTLVLGKSLLKSFLEFVHLFNSWIVVGQKLLDMICRVYRSWLLFGQQCNDFFVHVFFVSVIFYIPKAVVVPIVVYLTSI